MMTKGPSQMEQTKINEKGLFEHADDLFAVLLKAGAVFAISAAVCLLFTPKLFHVILNRLLSGYELTIGSIRPTEILMTEIELAVIGGAVLSAPVTVPMIWSYLKPALTGRERRAIAAALFPSVILFVIGFCFAYFGVLPMAIGFLVGQSHSFGVIPFWTVSSYVSFILMLGLSFGFAFQLPVVIFILGRLGLVTCSGLRRVRKYVIVILFILAAIITPPDAVSQIVLAVPLVCLYELSILVVRFTERRCD